MLITVDSHSATRLLRIYGINPPAAEDLAPGHEPQGIPATIDGMTDAQSRRIMRLKIGGRRSSRPCPLGEADAAALVDEFHAEDLLAADPKIDRVLVHLLTKCSKLYLDSGVSELHLVLYLTTHGYRTHAVYMLRPRSVTGVLPWRRSVQGPHRKP